LRFEETLVVTNLRGMIGFLKNMRKVKKMPVGFDSLRILTTLVVGRGSKFLGATKLLFTQGSSIQHSSR